MGCECSIYRTTEKSHDQQTRTTQLVRTEILDLKSWELGELLTEETEAPNGHTVTADPTLVISALSEYLETEDCASYEVADEVKDCIKEIETAEEAGDSISINVWY